MGLLTHEMLVSTTKIADTDGVGLIFANALNVGKIYYFTKNAGLKAYINVLYATGSPKIAINFGAIKADMKHTIHYVTTSGNFDLFYEFGSEQLSVSPFVGIGLGGAFGSIDLEGVSSKILGLYLSANLGVELSIDPHVFSLTSRVPVLAGTGHLKPAVFPLTLAIKPKVYNVLVGYAYKF